MPTLANDLVQFLMSLFGNHEAAQAFLDDPEGALDDAGLGGVCSADVDAAMPVILDFAPITVNASSFERSYNTGGNGAATGGGTVAVTPPPSGGDHGDHGDRWDHSHAVQQLHNVVNNYSWTSTVDDRDTITDQSVNQNIWAHGDVSQYFDNHAVIASGDRAVAAGDDVDMKDSNNIRDSYNTDNSNDSSTDNSVNAGRDASVGNTHTDIDDSFNTDVDLDVADSYNDNSDNSDSSDHSDNSDNRVDNSDNSDHSDHSVDVRDVGNTENNLDNVGNTTTDNSLAIADSFQDNSDNSLAVTDSFQDNSDHSLVAVDSFQDNSEIETHVALAGDDAAAS
ncbi:IniB N-terminal domain-containing protein [Pseudarthrobacter sulfonivorans]|uniref:IniB N-terminal domain-containing protein n=1 Tax=Pseudarthrobacter sulfonivorans TaxID=121292 RepID=UPI00210470C2|nr:IniB N-terminal domain-containing protein [Pseudarthrobacter sulfonivorans]